jgi:hypothetical protein
MKKKEPAKCQDFRNNYDHLKSLLEAGEITEDEFEKQVLYIADVFIEKAKSSGFFGGLITIPFLCFIGLILIILINFFTEL